MDIPAKAVVVAVAVACAIAGHADTKVTYRDAQGRLQGTATTDCSGKTTCRDSMGRLKGTKTTR